MKPKSFLKRVIDFAVSELERRSQRSYPAEPAASWQRTHPDEVASQAEQSADVPAALPEAPIPTRPHRSELDVVRSERGALRVRWALDSEAIQRSSRLIDAGAVLCLRLISFSPARDHVVREVQDRPSVATAGECEIGRIDGRAVVALGLRHGGRFVSIAHHIV